MMEESNFAEDIEEAAAGERIIAVRITQDVSSFYGDDPRLISDGLLNKPLPWQDARPLLDYAYDSGYGAMDCHDITAWTETRVLFVHEYDGSTYIRTVDRNPAERNRE